MATSLVLLILTSFTQLFSKSHAEEKEICSIAVNHTHWGVGDHAIMAERYKLRETTILNSRSLCRTYIAFFVYVVSVHFLVLALGESGLGNLAVVGLLVVQRACGWESQHSMHTCVYLQ